MKKSDIKKDVTAVFEELYNAYFDDEVDELTEKIFKKLRDEKFIF